jgi:hypothetical protein
MARHAEARGYSIGAKHGVAPDDFRNQTRYLYLYMLFRVVSQVLTGTPEIDNTNRQEFYAKLTKLRADYLAGSAEQTAFAALLDAADTVVATYMGLARELNWFFDRNAFLKSQELLNPDHSANEWRTFVQADRPSQEGRRSFGELDGVVENEPSRRRELRSTNQRSIARWRAAGRMLIISGS